MPTFQLAVAGLLPVDGSAISPATCEHILSCGFNGVSVFMPQPLETTAQTIAQTQHALQSTGLRCAQLNGAYECLIHPDNATPNAGIRAHAALTRMGRAFNAHCVYVRPGSHNPRGHWWHHPENHTAKTFDTLIASCKQLAQVAEQEGMLLAIEGHVSCPISTPQKARDLLDAVGSPNFKFSMDPVNFVGTVRDVFDTSHIIHALFDLMAKDTVILHAKDCAIQDGHVVHIDEVLLGTGTLRYDLILNRLHQECPSAWILIEHLPDSHIPLAHAALLNFIANM